MISSGEFFKKINERSIKSQFMEFRFGRILNDSLFQLDISNLDDYIKKIKIRNYPYKYKEYTMLTDGQNNYYLDKDNSYETFRQYFSDSKLDLSSAKDIRIIFKNEKKIDAELIGDKESLILVGMQDIIFKVDKNIDLIINNSNYNKKEENKNDIFIISRSTKKEDLEKVYELQNYLFG